MGTGKHESKRCRISLKIHLISPTNGGEIIEVKAATARGSPELPITNIFLRIQGAIRRVLLPPLVILRDEDEDVEKEKHE